MIRSRSTRLHAMGFSLLEAIIALTVMATSLIALYSWLSSSAIAVSRVQESARSLENQRTALAIIETLNPLSEPVGERRLESLTVRWKARPLTETRVGVSRAGLPSAFDLALYELDVEVQREDGTSSEFQVRRAGWQLARPFDPEVY